MSGTTVTMKACCRQRSRNETPAGSSGTTGKPFCKALGCVLITIRCPNGESTAEMCHRVDSVIAKVR